MKKLGKKKITILHSNDIHGDFKPEFDGDLQVGGLALLSGYINACRQQSDNTLYVNTGDMFRGSILDSDTSGMGTAILFNMVAPDVATIGNHEVDYGFEHLLFIEKVSEFPIINSNLFIHGAIKDIYMFNPYKLITVDGVKILFIGLLTVEAVLQTKLDDMLGDFIDIEDPLENLKRLYSTVNLPDADITILMTHIGLNADIELAKNLDPSWNINMIIGGHSHELTEEPVVVNGIPIVQVGTGSSLIGRFDIEYLPVLKKIASCKWQYIPINSNTAVPNTLIEETINKGFDIVGEKNQKVLTTLKRALSHAAYLQDTEVGYMCSDALKQMARSDIALIGSNSIRSDSIGPIITLGDLKTYFPYTDPAYIINMTGSELKQAFEFLLNKVTSDDDCVRYYQISDGLKIVFDTKSKSIKQIELNNEPIDDDRVYSLAVETFLYTNMDMIFGITPDKLKNAKNSKKIDSAFNMIQDYLLSTQDIDVGALDRIRIK